MKTEGNKHDQDKMQMNLIAPEMLIALAVVLTFGARKYSPRNWEKGMSWSRGFSALMRHMWAWWGGESKDKGTGYSGLALPFQRLQQGTLLRILVLQHAHHPLI